MGRTITTSSASSASTSDPRKEGLPLFATWSHDGSPSRWGLNVYDSGMNLVSSPMATANYSSPSYYGGMMSDAGFGYSGDYTGVWQTSGTLSTNSTWSTNWVSSVQNCSHYPVMQMGTCSAAGSLSSFYNGGWSSDEMYLITNVLPEGVRPRTYVWLVNDYIYKSNYPNGYSRYYQDRLQWTTVRPGGSTTTCYGKAGYNERTKTLVIISNNTSVSDVMIFKSTVDLYTSTFAEFFAASTKSYFQYAHGGSSAESQYRGIVVVGDNDKCAMIRHAPSGDVRGHLLDLKALNANTSYYTAISTTTSYGNENGAQAGIRYNATWSNKWIAAYAPYYYYGAGLCGHIVSTEDPSRFYTIQNTSSTGNKMMPIGKNNFLYQNSSNADSQRHNMTVIDLTKTATTGVDSQLVSDGSGWTSKTNGSALSLSNSAYWLGSNIYTTDYPTLLTVNWWPTQGDYSFQFQR